MLLAVTNNFQLSNLDFSVDTFYQTSLTCIFPFQITGIVDGDGSFGISIIKNKTKTNWLVIPSCTIVASLNPDNYNMFIKINSFFGKIGTITINKNTYHYRVMGLKNCLILRNHFNKYELMTYKLVYFKLWSQVLDIMEKGDHLTKLGLLQIVNIKASFKKGLNSKLLEFFQNQFLY